jgi:hypothetical protein
MCAKVLEKIVAIITSQTIISQTVLEEKLDLHEAESVIHRMLYKVANILMEKILVDSSKTLYANSVECLKSNGLGKIVARPLSITTATGAAITVQSPYAKKVPDTYTGTRHGLELDWQLVYKCTPLMSERVAYLSMLSPSYDIGHQLIRRIGIDICTSKCLEITNAFAEKCKRNGDTLLLLGKGESVKGKRVVLSVDGGRTRIRIENGKLSLQMNKCYDGAWKEPKLFVIDIIDEDGHLVRTELPIYGARFGEEEVLELLEKTLRSLQIEEATEVQIVADGAVWIWQNVKSLLLKLGVEESKITETLDYYHAIQHLNKLIEQLPARFSSQAKEKKRVLYKKWLWEGNWQAINDDFWAACKKPNAEALREMNYFEKHKNHIQYAHYQKINLFCGSGIVESGVRRVINQRFKNNGTFWHQKTVENLYLLRGAIVSKRWNNLVQNLKAA